MGITPRLIKLSTLFVCLTVVVASASDKPEPPQSTKFHTDGSGAVAVEFRPALIDELTALILQYALYDREDRETLAANLGLALFHQELGVLVTGAGCAEINGFYRRRHAKEGPPE